MSLRLAASGAGLLLMIGSALPASARQAQVSEAERVREAERLEATGDMVRAAALLEEVLQASPGSVPAVLALERVLRVQGRLARLPAHAEALVRADPASAGIGYQVMVRAYDALGDEAAVEDAGDRWIRLNPRVETPYRELSAVWAARGRLDRAIEVLERGRATLAADDALALELGEAYARAGDAAAAAVAWERAVGQDGRGLRLVRRQLTGLPDGGAEVATRLVEALARDGAAMARRRAAVQLAIDAGLGGRVLELASGIAQELDTAERDTFLRDLAGRADGAGLHDAAYWAYSELLSDAGGGDAASALRIRAAELALAAGDSAAAKEQLDLVEGSTGASADDRRRAAAQRIELLAGSGHAERALSELESFRAQHPDAPELDRAAAAVAGLFLAAGNDADAERALTGADGPAASVARAQIALRRGDIARARASLLSAAPSLRGAEATEAISLATVLGRVSPEGGRLLGGAVAASGAGEASRGVEDLERGAGSLTPKDAAVVLDFAAALAERHGLAGDSERIRRRIIDDYPESREAPAAMLALARSLLRGPNGADAARALLERLVVDHPGSALAPQARRELESLGRQ